MQSLPQSVFSTPLASGSRPRRMRRREELIYEVVTIAAMLIVLVTVWVF
jgi:hypothetical protein